MLPRGQKGNQEMSYREIRVRPVVRYIVTDFECSDDMRSQSSTSLGLFDNAKLANRVAEAVVDDARAHTDQSVEFEPARQLKIEWLRGPGEPKEAIRWELIDQEIREVCERGMRLDKPAISSDDAVKTSNHVPVVVCGDAVNFSISIGESDFSIHEGPAPHITPQEALLLAERLIGAAAKAL